MASPNSSAASSLLARLTNRPPPLALRPADRFAQITHISTAVSLVMCLTMALSGFLVFTDKTQANILNNFPQADLLINIARLCFGLNMFTTLPLEAFVCREVRLPTSSRILQAAPQGHAHMPG